MHECSHGVPALGYRECYCGLKDRLRHGEHLSPDELAFVGHYPTRAPRDGWRCATLVYPSLEVGAELSPEDSALPANLMGAERTEFLR